MGKSPEVTDDAVAGLKADAETRKETGEPVLQALNGWDDEDFIAAEKASVEEFANVDMKLFDDFFNNSNVRSEEVGDTQAMYAEITKVIQAIVADKKADVTALMKKASKNYQKVLDEAAANEE